MRFSLTDLSVRRWAVASTALILVVSALIGYGYQRSSVHVEYSASVSSQTRAMVEALVRGAMPEPAVSAAELQRRYTYAAERFAGATTDRGRFYVCAGSPDSVESQSLRGERWIYKSLGFAVTFVDVPQNSTYMPPGVPASRWIPLNENCGIVLRDLRAGATKRGVPVASGVIMAKVQGVWTVVRQEGEAETIPLGQ